MAASPALDFDLNAYALPRRALVEQHLSQYLGAQDPAVLWEAMRYSTLSAGKRVRALLCLAAAEAFCASLDQAAQTALPCACAIEMVHAMSLIHDDLPCMDNDDFRRGKPTNHKAYGEATALLSGDALLVHAFETLLKHTPATVDRQTLLDVAAQLAHATGPHGMVGGQVADAIATGLVKLKTAGGDPTKTSQIALLESIHKRKTGALLSFSVWSGARLADAPEQQAELLLSFGELLGLAFQIADDLLDLTGDLKTLGKTPGKDQAAGKLTWVSAYGEAGARSGLKELEEQAQSVLSATGLSGQALAPLLSLLNYAVNRTN